MQRTDYPIMKTENNRCVALEGEVGTAVKCSVYNCRPQACRLFEPGSKLCLEARSKLGL
jgi:Fe-S-cluster containining protein